MPGASSSELRRFGLTVGGIFVLLGALSRWRGHTWPPIVFVTVGVLLFVPGLVAPLVLGPVQRVWMRFAVILGEVNSRIILTVLFYLVIAPMGLVLRYLVRDPHEAEEAVQETLLRACLESEMRERNVLAARRAAITIPPAASLGPMRRLANDLRNGLHGDARCMLAGLRAAHSVGQNIKPPFGVDKAVIFVIGSDATFIGQREGFEHVREFRSYVNVARRAMAVKWEIHHPHALETPATHARNDQVRALGFRPAVRPYRRAAGFPR